MSARIIFTFIVLGILSPMEGEAQQVLVPHFSGDVFADGRPVTWTVEVRLEAQDASLVDTAHTFGSSRFTFRDVTLQLGLAYFLVVREYGYKDLQYKLYLEDFRPDQSHPGIYYFAGLILLNLEKLPPEKKADEERITGSKTIDAKLLKAKVPEEAQKEYALALEDRNAKDSKAAIAHLEKAVELAPEYYDALNQLGAEYLKAEQYGKAKPILERACALNSDDPIPLTNLGVLYFGEGEKRLLAAPGKADAGVSTAEQSYRKAVEVFEKALQLDPRGPRINLYLGISLYRIGAYERAETLLTKVLTLDSQSYDALRALVDIFQKQGRYDAALKQSAADLDANPNSPQRATLEALKTQITDAVSREPGQK